MSDNHSPVKTEPIHGHDGIAYEAVDVKAGVVIWSLLIVAALGIAGFVLMLGVQKYFQDVHPLNPSPSALAPDRVIPSAPQVQVHPWEDLPEMRAAEKEELETSGRDQAGRMHIPIDKAMSEVLSRLKVDPNAPKGLTTPGGQGREYSRSLNETRGIERPQIEGEIRKNVR